MKTNVQKWFASGAPWVWLNAAAVSASILLVVGLLSLIAWRGLGHFWPSPILELSLRDTEGTQRVIAGIQREVESVPAERLRESGMSIAPELESVRRILLKTGNRDVTGQDFVWVIDPIVVSSSRPLSMVYLERTEWGAFIGRLLGVKQEGAWLDGSSAWDTFNDRLGLANSLRERIDELEGGEIGAINYQLERLRLQERRLEIEGEDNPEERSRLAAERARLQADYERLEQDLLQLNQEIRRDMVVMQTPDGAEVELPLYTILDAWRPNDMSLLDKLGHYLSKAWEFVSEDPREANTEGGIFPAIYGTILMVLLMSVLVTPLGVVAALYLKEYARQGLLTRTIRIAVNNLAGVPSIVYGVFGLGFFVYTLGGSIDRIFFPEALPSPTYGTGGLFWASLTLALLTLPVVIVSTEEGLARIPRTIREGSLALGATRWETLWRTVLPMASPAIMTGMILAVARAAGEVAPLMLVGVVKLAPSLPLDGNYPFLHPERKFMHLGFHIYDVGFQSPNVEAARPLVYATALLLVVVTILLNLVAIAIRNRLREKYRGLEV
jgi:phosphate transport system permease protein